MKKWRIEPRLLLLLISLLFLFCACTPQEAAPDMAEAEPEKAVSEPGSAVAPEALAHPPVAGEAAIQWQEPALEALVREKLGKPEGEIYPSELDYIWGVELVGDTHIYFNADGGYEMFQQENAYFEADNAVSARLMNPADIELYDRDSAGRWQNDGAYAVADQQYMRGSVASLADFAHFRNLKYLYIYKNNLKELSGLAGAEQLIELKLRDCCIADITPLAELAALPQLSSLILTGNQIEDITPLFQLGNLKLLQLRSNSIHDLSGIAALAALETLVITDNPIDSLHDVAQLSGLRGIHFSETLVNDLTPLSEMTSLTFIGMENLQVESIDFAPLALLDGLRSLYAGQEQAEIVNIRSLAGLEGMTQLELIPSDDIPEEDIQWLREQLPNCYFYL